MHWKINFFLCICMVLSRAVFLCVRVCARMRVNICHRLHIRFGVLMAVTFTGILRCVVWWLNIRLCGIVYQKTVIVSLRVCTSENNVFVAACL
jgi:hypothetical protein